MARERDLTLLFRITRAAAVLGIVGIALAVLLGRGVLTWMFGTPYVAAYPVLIAFAVVFSLSLPSTLLGYPYFAALGNARLANKSVLVGGGVQLVSLTVLYIAHLRRATDVVWAVVLVEIVVIALRIRLGHRFQRQATLEALFESREAPSSFTVE